VTLMDFMASIPPGRWLVGGPGHHEGREVVEKDPGHCHGAERHDGQCAKPEVHDQAPSAAQTPRHRWDVLRAKSRGPMAVRLSAQFKPSVSMALRPSRTR
jgi:hypothetical protein